MFHHLVLLLVLLAPGAPVTDAGLHDASTPAAVPTPTFAEQVVELTNVERLNNGGLPPLKQVAALDAAAQGHSAAMAEHDFFMHCDPDTGKSPWDRMRDAGYSYIYAAENLAAGYATPAAVVEGWMTSPYGHRENILSTEVRELGIGYTFQAGDQIAVRYSTAGTCASDSTISGPFNHYWTQDLGRRGSYYPVVIEREAFYAGSVNVALYIYGPPGATAMRFSNDAAAWSDWAPFDNTRGWVLSPGNGSKIVYGQVTTGASTYTYSDTIVLDARAPAAAAVRLVGPGAPVTLTWDHAAANMAYAIYRSDANPYFAPGDDSTPVGSVPAPANDGDEISFGDTSAMAGINYFYVTRATGGDGLSVADSNRVGRYIFTLVAGN